MSQNKITVVIPVFNERDAILTTFTSLDIALSATQAEYEIIAVNDGSTDGSDAILNNLNIKNFFVVRHPINRGYGAALKTGITHAKYPWILITDADGTYPVESIPSLLEHMHSHDMVVGARSGQNIHDTLSRKIGRGIVRVFASYVSGAKIEDVNSGFRIFKKEHAKKFWHLFPDGFSFTTTLSVASHTERHGVKYIPIDYRKRSGKSSINPAKDFLGFLSLVTRLAIYFRPLKIFVPLSFSLFALSWIVLVYGYLSSGTIFDVSWAILLITSVQVLLFGFLADIMVKRSYNN
ncbi:MAG: glycosyltransferase family 2 protein [Candidatus Spechtbacterales bacterium]